MLSSSSGGGGAAAAAAAEGRLNLDMSITDFLGVRARAFDPWPADKPLPCLEPEPNWFLPQIQRSPAHEGLLFVKELKTGGSTAAGINLRIARNLAKRKWPSSTSSPQAFDICKVRNDHATAEKLDYIQRDRSKSFLWTVIRDPTSRAISAFFHFRVSRGKIDPSDKNFQDWISGNTLLKNYYLKTLSFNTSSFHIGSFDPVAAVNNIIQEYDFIGTTERMEHSYVPTIHAPRLVFYLKEVSCFRASSLLISRL
jgi:hypothetical protein